MHLLALHGAMHCGKDTAFGILHREAERRGLVAERRAFADKLKLAGMRLMDPNFTLDDPEFLEWANALKEGGAVSFAVPLDDFGKPGKMHVFEIDGRTFWERLGTESHRVPELFGPDCWIDLVLPEPIYFDHHKRDDFDSNAARLHLKLGVQDITVITDLRFPNEARRVRNLGGEVWYIDRPDGDGHDDGHASRLKLPDELINRVVLNDGTLEQYESRIAETFNSYMEDKT